MELILCIRIEGINISKNIWEERIKTDVSFRLIRNTRQRIHHALNGKSKPSSKLDILGIDVETYRKWIEWQLTSEMDWRHIENDHVKPISSFDVSKDENLKEAFSWKNTRLFLEEIQKQKGIKYNFPDYQLQFTKAYQFLKLNEEGLHQNLFW